MDRSKFISLVAKLQDFNNDGTKAFEDGTILIGRVPYIAPYAWLHTVYAPIDDKAISVLEDSIGLQIPSIYKSFLLISNGLNLFHMMSLDGLRANYRRTVEDALRQPFDIVTPNTIERPKKADPSIFYIGGYSCGNGAWLYIDIKTNKVHLCKRWTVKSIYEWQTFDEMLEDEISRMLTLFTREGKKRYPAKNLLPPFNPQHLIAL